MLNRRKILLSGAATAAVASFSSPLRAATAAMAQPTPNTEAARMYAMFDAFVQKGLDRSPEGTTSLGLDTGARAYEKSKLDDRSLAAIAGGLKDRPDRY